MPREPRVRINVAGSSRTRCRARRTEQTQIPPRMSFGGARPTLDGDRKGTARAHTRGGSSQGKKTRKPQTEAAAPITIGDNVWLGGGVIVCPGVTVGADTVVGAGAVVTEDIPPGVLAAGVPARILRSLVGG